MIKETLQNTSTWYTVSEINQLLPIPMPLTTLRLRLEALYTSGKLDKKERNSVGPRVLVYRWDPAKPLKLPIRLI